MQLKNTFESLPDFRFVIDKLQFFSSLGHNYLLNSQLITDKNTLADSVSKLEDVVGIFQNENLKSQISKIGRNIHNINDITPTISFLKKGTVLDDIQLFEIKKSIIYIKNVSQIVADLDIKWLKFHNLQDVLEILDPDNTGIPHFYIYSSYSDELKSVRSKIENCSEISEKEKLRFEEQKIEESVRENLSDKIRPAADFLTENIQMIAELDILIAKARYAIETKACKPIISNNHCYKNIINPAVDETLRKQNRRFQPVNISFSRETILITGANMGGKSVLLQTLALVQFMFQFGFYIPADYAEIAVVDEVICSFGDRQSSQSGLSSFAVEILTIDKIIKSAKSGKNILALVDELARTTNPEEGRLLVSGFLKMCEKYHLTAIITTHYGGINASCKKLRVKGLQIPENITHLTNRQIADFMDYSLVETSSDEVPKEALNIARLLHVDEELIDECRM